MKRRKMCIRVARAIMGWGNSSGTLDRFVAQQTTKKGITGAVYYEHDEDERRLRKSWITSSK